MRISGFIFLMMMVGHLLPAQTSLNKIPLDSTLDPSNFSFIVTGHIYGDGTNLSGYPAGTFLANLDKIKTLHPAFVWFTGDVFKDVQNDYPNYQQALFSKVGFPLFNAVGNHDLSGDFYEQNIGATWYSFAIGKNLFITLDAESGDSKIEGEQFEFFKTALANAALAGFNNVFISSHRPIWAETNPEFAGLFTDNTRSVFGDNFVEDIQPLLQKHQNDFEIYWFSGSMGNVPVSFFYHNSKRITYIQTAIRNLKRDAILKVTIKDKFVDFETISLTGQQLDPVENYNLDFWKVYKKPVTKFNYRLVPLYIKLTLTHRYFWYGISLMFLIVMMALLLFKKRNK